MSITFTEKTQRTPTRIRDNNNSIPAKVLVLDSDVVTFETVINGLCKVIPNMTRQRAIEHAYEVHNTGQSIVWEGDLELAEAYAKHLCMEGMKADVG